MDAIINEIVASHGYGKEEVTECVMVMWEKGLAYDDPQKVLIELKEISAANAVIEEVNLLVI